MPEVVLTSAELQEAARVDRGDTRAATCRIAWDPNTDEIQITLYDAWGCMIGAHEVEASPAAAPPTDDDVVVIRGEGIE